MPEMPDDVGNEPVADEDTVMNIRMSKADRAEIKAAADAEGFRITSEWVRVTLKRAARQVLQPAEAR